ncbi:LysR family transcriptional regulator [Marinomonas epiphytica]
MIKELKTLLSVASEGTFAGAGNKIGLTQAAVSAQMQRLEQELGMSLFERVGRTMQLNQTGYSVLEQAKDIIERYHQLGTTSRVEEAESTITMGAITTIQRAILPMAIAQFQQNYKTTYSRVVPGVSMDLFDKVDTGELDLAVIIKPTFNMLPDLEWQTLIRQPFRLIAPRTWEIADWRSALRDFPFVRYDRTSFGGRQVDRWLQKQQMTVRDKCEVDEVSAIIKLVELEVGVAIVPQTDEYPDWGPNIQEVSLEDMGFEREIGLVFKPHAIGNPLINAMVDAIVLSVEKIAPQGGKRG